MKRRRITQEYSIDSDDDQVNDHHSSEFHSNLIKNIYKCYKLTEDCDIILEAALDKTRWTKLNSNSISDAKYNLCVFFSSLQFRRVPAHRIVLFTTCPFLKTLLNESSNRDNNIISISDIDGITLKLFIDYCYTGRIGVGVENVNAIIIAATKLNLPDIQAKCEAHLTKTLRPDNCFRLWLLASKCSFVQLAERTINFIRDNFQHLIRMDEFTKLQLAAVECLLMTIC